MVFQSCLCPSFLLLFQLMRTLISLLLFLSMGPFVGLCFADTEVPAPATAAPVFGAFRGIAVDHDYIQGVKVDEAGKIWIMLDPKVKERELKLKISMKNGGPYRDWFTGSPVLVSPAGQGKAADAWTDWIETSANYIEYWMDEKLILHLERI